MFPELEVAVKEVAALDAHALSEGELAEAAVEIMRLRSALEAGEAAILAAFDRRKVWAADGAKAASAWLAAETRHSSADCGGRLRLGRTMADMPLAAEAWGAGDISAAHLRRLTRARNRRTVSAFAEGEGYLVHSATTMGFEDFSRIVDYWLLAADPDGADESDMERADRRRVSLNETIGGMHSGSILLDPISGTIVSGELGRLEKKLFDSDWAEARERLGREPLVGELSRTSDQRRADALVEMARRSAGADGTKGARPLFSLVLGSSALRHLCGLENGRVVSPAALRRWFDDAEVERILFEGETGRVIDVSRKRNFTGALRRLIQVRDRVCFHRTCDEPGSRCEVDHVIPWAAGGMTDQDNGRLACGFHNRWRKSATTAAIGRGDAWHTHDDVTGEEAGGRVPQRRAAGDSFTVAGEAKRRKLARPACRRSAPPRLRPPFTPYRPCRMSAMMSPTSVGLRPTWTPASRRASIFP